MLNLLRSKPQASEVAPNQLIPQEITAHTGEVEEGSESQFQTGKVITITGGHFIHDTFSAFLSPLLPLIIERLSLSLALAGTLSAVIQLPSILNPLIGYLDEKINLGKLMFFAPAITATLMCAMGLAPNYLSLIAILFLAGMSSAIYHALAPALNARISGKRVGRGMSFFMAGGEAGRTLGPLIAVAMVSLLGLTKLLPVALIGWAVSLVLYKRFHRTAVQPARGFSFASIFPYLSRYFLPVFLLSLSRSFIITSLGVYLPTLLKSEGASLWTAGSYLALYQFAGVIGALSSGTLSDRFGRKRILFFTMILSSLLLILFLNLRGWISIPVLLLLGFLTLSFQPVMLALTQDHFPRARSVANGLYMALNFIALSAASIVIGILGDRYGLRGAFFWSAAISLVALPVLLVIPKTPIVLGSKA